MFVVFFEKNSNLHLLVDLEVKFGSNGLQNHKLNKIAEWQSILVNNKQTQKNMHKTKPKTKKQKTTQTIILTDTQMLYP